MYACGLAASVREEVTGEWIKDVLDVPRDASFAFTTGCQLADVKCLAAARHAAVDRVNWDVERDGLIEAPAIRALEADRRRGAIERALRFLGVGTRALGEHDRRLLSTCPRICTRDRQTGPCRTGGDAEFETRAGPVCRP